MSQHDYDIDDQGGLSFLSDINGVLDAIKSSNSGTTAPSETAPHMWWADTTAGIMKQRNAADTAWVSRFAFDATLLNAGNNLSELLDKPAAFTAIKQPASTTTTGVVEKATPSEMTSGTTDKYPDAALVKSYVDTVYSGVKLPINGLVVTNNITDLEHDIDISAGSVNGEVLATGITKRLDATFAEGDDNGGMIGSLPTSGVIYIFLIKKTADNALDVYAETTDGTSPPSGWTVIKRIAARITDSSANLQRVIVSGSGEKITVYPYTESVDWNVSTVGTSKTAYPISGVLSCPPSVSATLFFAIGSGTTTEILASSMLAGDVTPSATINTVRTNSNSQNASSVKEVLVDSNRQVGIRRASSDVSSSFSGGIESWIEDRS